MTDPFFKVVKTDNEISELDDFELITKFYRGDAAIVQFNVTEISPIPSTVTYYSVSISKYNSTDANYNEIFASGRQTLYEIKSNNKYAIKDIGLYRACIYIYDCYGNIETLNVDFEVSIRNVNADFFVLRLIYLIAAENWSRMFHSGHSLSYLAC
jgi:hypothetical protein